jgi:hypothetical protein
MLQRRLRRVFCRHLLCRKLGRLATALLALVSHAAAGAAIRPCRTLRPTFSTAPTRLSIHFAPPFPAAVARGHPRAELGSAPPHPCPTQRRRFRRRRCCHRHWPSPPAAPWNARVRCMCAWACVGESRVRAKTYHSFHQRPFKPPACAPFTHNSSACAYTHTHLDLRSTRASRRVARACSSRFRPSFTDT